MGLSSFAVVMRVESVTKRAIPASATTFTEADDVVLSVLDQDDASNQPIWPLTQQGRVELDQINAVRMFPRQRYRVTFEPIDSPTEC